MQWCQWTHHEYDVAAAAAVLQQSHSHRKWKENQRTLNEDNASHDIFQPSDNCCVICVLGVINRFTHFCACYNACDPRECANGRTLSRDSIKLLFNNNNSTSNTSNNLNRMRRTTRWSDKRNKKKKNKNKNTKITTFENVHWNPCFMKQITTAGLVDNMSI